MRATSTEKGNQEMASGVIIKWLSPRTFGFIKPDGGGADVFLHLDAFQSDDETKVGDFVNFDIANDARSGRPRARECQVSLKGPRRVLEV